MILTSAFDSRGGHVDVLHFGCATRRGVDTECARVRKQIHHATPCRERPRQRAVLALIDEEPGLLTFARVDEELQSVLLDRRRWLAVADHFRLERKLLDLADRDVVLEVGHPCHSERSEEPPEWMLRGGFLAVFAVRNDTKYLFESAVRDLDDDRVVVTIDDQRAEPIAVTVDQSRGVCPILQNAIAPPYRCLNSRPDRAGGQLFIAESERAHPDLRMQRMKT